MSQHLHVNPGSPARASRAASRARGRRHSRGSAARFALVTLLLAAFAACEADSPVQSTGDPALSVSAGNLTIRIISGDGETVSPGDGLTAELELTEANGGAVKRAFVEWAVTSGGGSTNRTMTRTNGRGMASVRWTTGPTPGHQTLEAGVTGVGTVTFTVLVVGEDSDDNGGGDDDGTGDGTGEGDGDGEGDGGTASGSLVVSPESLSLSAIGAEAQLDVEAFADDGTEIADPGVEWSSSDQAVVTVNAEGRVLAVAAGTALVIATASCCISDTVSVQVEQAVHSLEVTPESARVLRGETEVLEAEALDSNGHVIRGADFDWASDNEAVATVDGSGRVTGIAEGSARIVATAGGVSDDAVVEVYANPAPGASSGIWIGPEELARLPTSGTAWNNVKSAADTNLRGGVLTDRDQHNARVMAAALVAARLNSNTYRSRVRDALVDLMDARLNTDDGLAVNRRLGSYAIAADLIGLSSFDSRTDARFRDWLNLIRNTEFQSGGGGTLAGYHERRPNNYGNHAGASRMAVSLYLGDQADFERALVVFRGYLGDRSAYAGFQYRVDWSWHLDEDRPRGINPKGATKNGRNIDGAMPDDQRRCGSFHDEPWPCTTGYSWEGLQGVVAMAWIAHRQGYPAFEWEDQAILRANVWLYEVNGHPAAGDDTWQPHVINYMYGTNFPAPIPSRHGKNVGWTDWTHSSR